jgi:hypothetical protein
MGEYPVAGLSRVELEPLLFRRAELGDVAGVEEIRAELAGRVWQGSNPYEWPSGARGSILRALQGSGGELGRRR